MRQTVDDSFCALSKEKGIDNNEKTTPHFGIFYSAERPAEQLSKYSQTLGNCAARRHDGVDGGGANGSGNGTN